jgi:F-type H+-transporting ATPase subunit epsilon
MAKEQVTLNVKILTEKGPIFQGTCNILFIPYNKEDIAILPQHTPIIALLSKGKIKIVDAEGTHPIVDTKSGILFVDNNNATVLVNA